jgi:hypothetical protein
MSHLEKSDNGDSERRERTYLFMIAAMMVKTAIEKMPMRTILRFQGICAM